MPLHTVDAHTLKQWLDRGEAVLVDVREPAEYAAESITGATLMPMGTITTNTLPDYTGKKLVLHCRKGARGGSACEKLLAENPALELFNLDGGISAWSAAGYPVACSGKRFLPLDRQVQLTVGLCVLVGSLLGFFVGKNFFLMTGFFGAGLTFAGLTGFCGLAVVMARMPWNQRCSSSVSNGATRCS